MAARPESRGGAPKSGGGKAHIVQGKGKGLPRDGARGAEQHRKRFEKRDVRGESPAVDDVTIAPSSSICTLRGCSMMRSGHRQR
eukprot:9462907-Pyramimonas_sp.AAC.1